MQLTSSAPTLPLPVRRTPLTPQHLSLQHYIYIYLHYSRPIFFCGNLSCVHSLSRCVRCELGAVTFHVHQSDPLHINKHTGQMILVSVQLIKAC
jgi:hypothetical protein